MLIRINQYFANITSRQDKKIARLYEQGATTKKGIALYLALWLGLAMCITVADVAAIECKVECLREYQMCTFYNKNMTIDEIGACINAEESCEALCLTSKDNSLEKSPAPFIPIVPKSYHSLSATKRADEVATTTLQEKNGIFYALNSNKPFTGKYVRPYDNGQPQSESNYKNGKLDGLLTAWHDNGQKAAEGNYKNGKQDGLITEWSENGQKTSEGNFKNGKADGLTTYWYENGQKYMEKNYKDGKINGLTTIWYENGQKKGEGNWKNEKQDGLTTEWSENGQKTSEVNYKDGLPIE